MAEGAAGAAGTILAEFTPCAGYAIREEVNLDGCTGQPIERRPDRGKRQPQLQFRGYQRRLLDRRPQRHHEIIALARSNRGCRSCARCDPAAMIFDFIPSGGRFDFPLFSPPTTGKSVTYYAIGLQAHELDSGAGSLQIGIGSIGDLPYHSLLLRQQQNPLFSNN